MFSCVRLHVQLRYTTTTHDGTWYAVPQVREITLKIKSGLEPEFELAAESQAAAFGCTRSLAVAALKLREAEPKLVL